MESRTILTIIISALAGAVVCFILMALAFIFLPRVLDGINEVQLLIIGLTGFIIGGIIGWFISSRKSS
ncbi:MAG: hypothetical protein WC595_01510 [Candidatus Nanoarchaeia archaeon]